MAEGPPPVDQRSTPALGPSGFEMTTGFPNFLWKQFIDETEYVPDLIWPHSVGVYHQMRSDSQIDALYHAITLPLRRYKFELDTNGARATTTNLLAKDLRVDIKGKPPRTAKGRTRNKFNLQAHARHALLALLYGHIAFEQVGEIADDGRWHLKKLSPIMPQTISEIGLADDGGLIYIRQNNRGQYSYRTPLLPVDRIVWYGWDMEGANWVGRSMLRSVYRNYLIKDRLLRVDAINHERAGGVPVIEAPEGASPKDIRALSKMAQSFRVGENAGGAIPAGAKLQLARAGTAGGNAPVDSIRYHDESMARKFLAMFLQLGQTKTGSRALAEEFIDLFALALDAVVDWFLATFNEHVIEDWVDWNFGEAVEDVPILTYSRDQDPQIAAQDLVALIDRNVIRVDDDLEATIRSMYGLPQKDPNMATRPRPAVPSRTGGGTSTPPAQTQETTPTQSQTS